MIPHAALQLDAGMTVHQVRERLAGFGIWSDSDDPAVAAVLDAWCARRRAVHARTTRDPAEFTRAQAADALRRDAGDARVVVRRIVGRTVTWHRVASVGALLELLDQSGGDVALGDALALGAKAGDRVHQLADLSTDSGTLTDAPPGIVLDGLKLIGVVDAPRLDSAPTGGGSTRRMPPAPPPSGGATRGTDSLRSMPAPAGAAPEDAVVREGAANDSATTVTAFPRVDAPDHVTAAAPFDVVVGLGTSAQSGDAPTPMTLPVAAGASVLDIEVRLVADGFDAPDGWTHLLRVPVADPTSVRITVPLVARPQDTGTRATTIAVEFAVTGVLRGTVTRHLTVGAPGVAAPAPAATGQDFITAAPAAPSLSFAPTVVVPDIELNIAKVDGDETSGTYRCTMRNAHGVPVPDAPLDIKLGRDPQSFAKMLIDQVPKQPGELLEIEMEGIGDTIRAQLPAEFFTLLQDVAAKVGPSRAVSLQLNSAEPYVPWELALVDPPIVPDALPYLGAQTAMGRWILGESTIASPPRTTLTVSSFALMAGMYKPVDSGLRRLPMAEAEVDELSTTYRARGATKYECSPSALASLLKASVGGGAQAVHFAGHGQVNATNPGDYAIFLDSGAAVSPLLFRRTVLGRKHAPFMFMNACMVGTAGELLGDFGGFPGACLAGNFTGFVAPLWPVDDTVAKWVALTFYDQAFASPPRPIAEIMRDIRQTFAQRTDSASYLAYVFYGNPALALT